MTESKDLTVVVESPGQAADYETLPQEEAPSAPKVGRWYWVKHGRTGVPWFGCVTAQGSNYVALEGIEYTVRVHLDNFEEVCAFEPDPDKVIKDHVDQHQGEVRELLAKVKETTARLSITTGPALQGGSDVRALAVHQGTAIVDYKAALVVAKEKTLPDLFKAIEQANRGLEKWLGASLIPLKAQAAGLTPAIKAIEDRIFSVQLYAGLVEEVEQIQDGKPAAVGEKIRLFQRRCYMDEECLARYETGGMEFKDLAAFDRWLLRPENLNRLIPFQRCIVAFQVRRNTKEREGFTIAHFIRMMDLAQLDKLTFLYIRNGEKVYRLNTAIEFGAKLFPDMDHNQLTGKLYVYMYGSGVHKIVTENQYLGMLEDEARQEREIEEKKAAAAKLPKDKRPYFSDYVSREAKNYKPYNKDNVYYDDISQHIQRMISEHVYYDDISQHIQRMISEHNRLVLVLQGLLDRSPVLHPHPQWSLWTTGGFEQALELIFDDSRTLTTGEAPDFEAYRAKLNADLKAGCVTVGQEVAWEEKEAEKEGERRRGDYMPRRYRPYGNPGPGGLAHVVRVGARSKACTFEWTRERRTTPTYGSRSSEEIKCSFVCPAAELFNVSAYRPGDFRQFFDDPRTRANYLQWAHLLLEAEEYHAGNRPLAPPKEMPKRVRTATGAREYRDRKRRKALVGKAVRLTGDVTTKSGKVYKEGTLWRVTYNEGKKFTVAGIKKDGQWDEVETDDSWNRVRRIQGVNEYDFEEEYNIPAEVKPEKKKPEASSPVPEPQEEVPQEVETEGANDDTLEEGSEDEESDEEEDEEGPEDVYE